jgi:hypothetical protein
MPYDRTHKSVQLLAAVVLIASVWPSPAAAEPEPVQPFEMTGAFVAANPIDDCVLATLEEEDIEPAPLCSDGVFVRRVYLDVIGTLPQMQEARDFLDDRSPDKRARLIDSLLERQEFADYWTMKWCDLLRVKSEFPINLWPNAVQAYHRWIHDAVAGNKPYNEFARELLTSSGSNFRVPAVNFYRAIQQRQPSAIAGAVALTFMGARLDSWPQAHRRGLETLFSRVAYKTTAEWKEEIVQVDPAASGPLEAVLPDGLVINVPAGVDPRVAFADWLIARDNPWFARNIVNRVWAWLMGRGIIHEPDDIRLDNPAVNPALLAYLEAELVNADYDLRHVYRLILNSRTYQQSSIPRSDQPRAEALFACYSVRRLEAEVLIDALNGVCGDRETYISPIPEPFTYIPEDHRTIDLADGSIGSSFLELFGRPARDTGRESERDNRPTNAQRLHLLNSTHLQRKIDNSRNLRMLIRRTGGDRRRLIRQLYLSILSRFPTADEIAAADGYLQTKGLPRQQAVNDLAWALFNTKEFLYRH